MPTRVRTINIFALVLVLSSLLACGEEARSEEAQFAGRWYLTCGDEVSYVDGSCPGWTAKPGVALCTTQAVGGGCMTLAVTCDPTDKCNRLLECATSDPTYQGTNYICPVPATR
jgi:hypothetical protein